MVNVQQAPAIGVVMARNGQDGRTCNRRSWEDSQWSFKDSQWSVSVMSIHCCCCCCVYHTGGAYKKVLPSSTSGAFLTMLLGKNKNSSRLPNESYWQVCKGLLQIYLEIFFHFPLIKRVYSSRQTVTYLYINERPSKYISIDPDTQAIQQCKLDWLAHQTSSCLRAN